jgi:hypothetical protein
VSQKPPGKPRRITDDQIRVLQAWIPLKQLARALGIAPKYAIELRMGKYRHKNPSP